MYFFNNANKKIRGDLTNTSAKTKSLRNTHTSVMSFEIQQSVVAATLTTIRQECRTHTTCTNDTMQFGGQINRILYKICTCANDRGSSNVPVCKQVRA